MNVHQKKVIELRNNGASYKEVANAIGITKDYAKQLCKQYGVQYSQSEIKQRGGAPLTFNEWQERINQKTDGCFSLIALDKTRRNEKQLTVKCNKCGAIKTITSITLRHCGCHCVECSKRDTRARQQQQKILNKEKRVKAEKIRIKKMLISKQVGFNFCKCGALLPLGVRTCENCKHDHKKAHAHRKEIKRRLKLRCVERDNDITLEKLYERDNGVCYLCGRLCNWNDYKVINGAFIVGKTYPTIEHVIPISRGGSDTWNNTRLACLYCNSKKSDKVAG